MSRPPLVVANWKMNHSATEAAAFAARFVPLVAPFADDLTSGRLEIALAPAFVALERLGRALAGAAIRLAAQDVHEAPSGAYTGEVSIAMLEDLDCRSVLIGHSERRALFGDDDARVAAKLDRVLDSRLAPILCVGETLAEREAGRIEAVLDRQLEAPLASLKRRLAATATAASTVDSVSTSLALPISIAYEPVWAIGTGRVATPEIAQTAHASIRRRLEAGLGREAGQRVRILYGGSVKPDNARSLLAQPDVDGALVGGASLDPLQFASIVATCRETRLEPS